MTQTDDANTLRIRLQELKVEHRDLDAAIAHLLESPPTDELMLRRLKKRKLYLKDQITLIEGMLEPDILA
ncbi:conserved protein of unknown function [Georgfuchsia toluolica]|uniref:DUF465 domain-containing protein n=1 Tax=Georgfuchsia toluolica TaxID=424218 RepID=A0A916N9G6_9PROT|nr:YdcH family protein [Georgfuchsia toluolica]CAG4883930.1 conserved protein of unknown function [Georgfuchsia toluolica]